MIYFSVFPNQCHITFCRETANIMSCNRKSDWRMTVKNIYFAVNINLKYFNNYFGNNMKNIKNTQKGIRLIITLKAKDSESPKIIKIKHAETI